MTTSSSDISRLEPADFVAAFGEQPSEYLAGRIRDYSFDYRSLALHERDHYIRRMVDVLVNENLIRAGEDRHEQWEAGWGANLGQLAQPFDYKAIIPGYFGKYSAVRWQQQLIEPVRRDFEYNSFSVIQDWLFDKYLRNVDTIYEFGCGTGHNLFRARAVNPRATLWGLDWATASQGILKQLNETGVDKNIYGHHFDYFRPDMNFRLAPGAAVYTAASLEQIGDRFEPFLAYLLDNKPALCIHIEPIAELLDETNLLDFLSISYFRRRNYLNGFYAHLKALEQDGRINIHLARRTTIGSLFIEGYSVVVWSPASSASA